MVCLIWTPSNASGETLVKDNTEQQHNIDRALLELGIKTASDKHSQQWLDTERKALATFLYSLPKELHPGQLGFRPLLLYKSPSKRMSHNKGKAHQLDLKIETNARNPLENDTANAFIRQLLHHLLHRYDRQFEISNSNEWQKLSGWHSRSFGLLSTANNQDIRAYAHSDGLENPAEDFATAAEQFFLPPASTMQNTIKCRTPNKYAFLKALFMRHNSKLEKTSIKCRSIDSGFLDDITFFEPNSGEPLSLGPINTETVKGFELLYATPGTGDASEIAGHLLLRIKLDNNPGSEASGIENPRDLVVSFLANTEAKQAEQQWRDQAAKLQCKANWFNLVDDGHTDFDALQSIFQSLKGLSGGFLTVMDRQTLAQAIKNYTVEEDRNLLRYKLNLSEKQKQSLLTRLYEVKRNYKAKYYFFSQNCASVLVKIVGQGIGDEEIAQFEPLVSPPNTLLGMFLRKGLAEPVYPTFNSYRKRGYLAQEQIAMRVQQLQSQEPDIAWPSVKRFFSKKQANRLQFVEELKHFALQKPNLQSQFYSLANLIQESEMVHEHKNLKCENYTSEVTAKIRQWQQQMIRTASGEDIHYPMETQNLLDNSYVATEKSAFKQGISSTGLFAYSFGAGHYHSRDIDNSIVSIRATLNKQKMGSLSNISMQRGNYLQLGSVDIAFNTNNDNSNTLQTWNVTALNVRKFKERLNTIPSHFSPAGNVGLGLKLLDFYGDENQDVIHGTLLGGELLFNLLSSNENNRFAYVSIGTDITRHTQPSPSNHHSHSHTGIMLPLSAEALWSFDNKRRWQWRNRFNYQQSLQSKLDNASFFSSSLSYLMGNVNDHQLLLNVSVRYVKFGNANTSAFASTRAVLSLELLRW